MTELHTETQYLIRIINKCSNSFGSKWQRVIMNWPNQITWARWPAKVPSDLFSKKLAQYWFI